jgi:hypothetical protein
VIRSANKGRGAGKAPDAFQRDVFAVCEDEYERTFGQPWHMPPGRDAVVTSGEAARMFIAFHEASELNKRAEDEARKLYEEFRAKMDRALAPARAFRERNGDGVGGAAARMFVALDEWFHSKIRPVTEIPGADEGRSEGRAAFVARFGTRAEPWYPKDDAGVPRRLSDRELAVVGILVGVGGPATWIATRGEHLTTANAVIHDEAKRVGALRSAQEKDRRGE